MEVLALDATRDETSTKLTKIVCISCILISLSFPILRGLYNIDLMTRLILNIAAAILFVAGILLINQELSIPKIMQRSKRFVIPVILNFIVLVLIPAIFIVLWANGEQVLTISGFREDRIILLLFFCIGVYFLAEAISTGIRSTISIDMNDEYETSEDDLEYGMEISYCLTNTSLDNQHKLKQQIIKSSFIKYTRSQFIPEQLRLGRFSQRRTFFNDFYEDIVDSFFNTLCANYSWPKKEKESLVEFLDSNLMHSVVADYLISQLYKKIKLDWTNQKIVDQSVFSLAMLLEFNFSSSNSNEMITLVKEQNSLLNFFVESEVKPVVKEVHYNRTRIFTAVLLSYFDYLSKFQVPVLTRKDDSQIIHQILESLISKHIEKYNRTGVDEFFFKEAQGEPISIQNFELDQKFKKNIDRVVEQLIDSRILFRTKSPIDEGIDSIVEMDDITEILSKWDEWS